MRRSRTSVMLAALIAIGWNLAACAGPHPLICEARGGPAWSQYRSQHFSIYSDAEPGEVAATADELELLRAQILEGMVSGPLEVPGRLRVVALADSRVFREVAGPHVAGYFTEYLGEPVIVVPIAWIFQSPEIIAHELGHYLSRYLFPVQPRWFSEGLAGFVETVGSSEPRCRGRVGAVSVQRARSVSDGRLPTAGELLSWAGAIDDDRPGSFHAGSWLLFGWLWNARSAQFAGYQRALSRGDPPDGAWRAAFPEYDQVDPAAMDRLDQAVTDYRQRGTFLSYPVKASAQARLSKVARVPPADVHLLLLGIRRRVGGSSEGASEAFRSELEEALQEDPLQPLALLRVTKNPVSLQEALRRSTAARPGYALGWALLGESLRDPKDEAEREAAYRKALSLEPDSPTMSAALAWHLVRTDRSAEAWRLATFAADAVPWSPRNLMTLALAAAGSDRCDEALEARRRALALAASLQAAERSQLRSQGEAVEARCGTGARIR
jgi:tetratricopeptide (TPR) repeat protein